MTSDSNNLFVTSSQRLDEDFYQKLEQLKQAGDVNAIEQYLLETYDTVKDVGKIAGISGTCTSCYCEEDMEAANKSTFEALEARSRSVIPVLNETACFYIEEKRYDEGIACFEQSLQEIKLCQLIGSQTHAVVLLNMAGACRLAGIEEEARSLMQESAEIMKALKQRPTAAQS